MLCRAVSCYAVTDVCVLSCRHVVNASGLSWNAGDMDFTGGQMVLTLKLISMAVCFQDAHSKGKEDGKEVRQQLQLCSCIVVQFVVLSMMGPGCKSEALSRGLGAGLSEVAYMRTRGPGQGCGSKSSTCHAAVAQTAQVSDTLHADYCCTQPLRIKMHITPVSGLCMPCLPQEDCSRVTGPAKKNNTAVPVSLNPVCRVHSL